MPKTLNLSCREPVYQELVNYGDGSPNCIWLAQIIASWQACEGVLPHALGLSNAQFQQLLVQRFPGYKLDPAAASGKTLDFNRMLEKQDLEHLLTSYAATDNAESQWLIAIIVAACLGSDHLWQDLGLWSRNDLSSLLRHNFPELAARNCHDMKWKKFLYKQLCEAQGLNLCRAPSCEFCQDYLNCFGDEE